MAPDPTRDAFLNLIEARRDIGGRFTNLTRVSTTGGDGYSSLVFKATDSQTNCEVAVKVFRPDRLPETYRFQSFCREAILMEQLVGARNILQWVSARQEFTERIHTTSGMTFDWNFPYFATELASTDVGTLIRIGTWSPEEKLIAFRDMCKAAQRIHRRNIAHRDMKPSNFLVMRNGEVKLSDFGCARDVSGAESPILSNYAAPPGDSRYTAPEMFGLLHDDEPAIALLGDVYSLGATLFELWAGTILGVQLFSPIFAGTLAQAMGAVQKRDRRRIYLQFVQSIASGNPLPGISAYSNDAPGCILHLLDDLYKSMAALDFRKRLSDYERIFLRIDQCLVVLRNQEKVARWRGRRELFRQNREVKCRLRRNELGSARTMGDSQ
jgi:serine/threonine protein kinase